MSKTFNPVTGTYSEDAPDSNVTNPADPKTGELGGAGGLDLVGPPIEGQSGRYAKGPDFMKAQIQLGARLTRGKEVLVCESAGSIYDAYWQVEE